MEPAKRETMLPSIVVLEMEIERVEGQRKLNQHKSDEDHVSVARHLFATGEPGALGIAEKIRALRPHLDYSADRKAEMPVSRKPVAATGWCRDHVAAPLRAWNGLSS